MKTKVYLFALTLMYALGLQAQTIMNIHQNNGNVLQIPLNTIDSITYTIPSPGNLATLTTTTVSSITETTAVSGGNIANDGGTLITQRGVCYSTSPSPTTANMTIISSSGSGSFTSNLTGLTANTTYYLRAYATNSAGTAYGNEVSFTTAASSGGIVTNPGAGVTFSGYTYASIVLGNGQEWMSENLRTTTYANGDPIPNVTNDVQWSNLTTGAWAHYDNNSMYENPYGKLYNWYTVDDPRNVCPNGWHVPSESEWNTLIGYLDPSLDALGEISLTAGGMMKSTGVQYWSSPNQDATNVSGFSGLPGGVRAGAAGASFFLFIGEQGWWWSSTDYAPTNAWTRLMRYADGEVVRDADVKTSGNSVRCLRN
jgi:uncharacterized protein (TIGR02145 family)